MSGVKPSTPLLATLCLAVITLSGCDDGSSEDDRKAAARLPAALAVTDVVCPAGAVDRQDSVSFRPVDPAASSPRLTAFMTLHDLGGRAYCVDSYLDEGTPAGVAQQITSYSVTSAADRADYGESYRTSDRTGSDELLNFPFAFQVQGACRRVTGRIVLTDHSGNTYSYTAGRSAGPRCG